MPEERRAKTNLNTRRIWILVPSLVLLLATAGFADIIPVVNGSFETLPGDGLPFGCGAGCAYSVEAIPGWTFSPGSSGGQFQPGTVGYFHTLSDGPTSAYSNGGVISQTVGETVQLGVTYTLMVDLGLRTDPNVVFAGSADLLINGNKYAAVGSTPTSGNWSTFTATYTGLSADVGDSITIELNSFGFQGNYDNVRLFDSSLPEPSYAGMLVMGLAGLMMLRLRRREA